MKPISILIFLLPLSWNAVAQRAPQIDSIHMVLLNPYIELEATQAINDMYNFKFEESMRNMKYLKYEYGWHPLPYFLMGLNYWWRIQPNLRDTQYDKEFHAYMDTTIFLAKRLHEEANPIEGAFFLAASYGFKARIESDRDNFRIAAGDGRKALKYLKESKDYTEYSPELLFGDGLINYYSKWIRENYPMLRPLMMFFPKGNKELGIKQLTDVSRNAFYSRTEAQYYLMSILYDEKKYSEARRLAKYLHHTYPDNSYFHRWHLRMLYQMGNQPQAEFEGLEIIQRIDSGYVGYESNTGRHAAYFLGKIYKKRQPGKAEKYLLMGLKYSEEVDATKKGYYFLSLYMLGEIAQKRGDKEQAEYYYRRVKKLSGRKHSANKKAKKALREL
ncbi:MAG: tol-pal system protein YbgF [Cytophagales bacterium]|nr:tol-pal system protein YbgF [Cytophagales bacterium]